VISAAASSCQAVALSKAVIPPGRQVIDQPQAMAALSQNSVSALYQGGRGAACVADLDPSAVRGASHGDGDRPMFKATLKSRKAATGLAAESPINFFIDDDWFSSSRVARHLFSCSPA
jgi:hypothetical protein